MKSVWFNDQTDQYQWFILLISGEKMSELLSVLFHICLRKKQNIEHEWKKCKFQYGGQNDSNCESMKYDKYFFNQAAKHQQHVDYTGG